MKLGEIERKFNYMDICGSDWKIIVTEPCKIIMYLSEMVNRIPGIFLISPSHQDFLGLTTEYSQCDNLH